jgi:ribose transport system ATP-binding protein
LYPPAGGAPGRAICRVHDLTFRKALHEISLDLHQGEVLGVFGLLGSGIEVLGRALYGALGPIDGGRIVIDGADYAPSTPIAGKSAGIGFVAAERKVEGIVPDLTVRENMTLPFLDRFRAGLALQRGKETQEVRRWIEVLGIRAKGPEQHIRSLSGGNQQKVCLARWLVEHMKMLVLEEPTRGVDIGARREIYAQLRELTRRGLALLVISSDAEEIAGLCDRILVLERGRCVAHFAHGVSPAALIDATDLPLEAAA